MKNGCLTPDALADLVRGNPTPEDEQHLSGCESCRRRVTLVRRIASAGLTPIADLTAEVDDLVARLLATPRATWWKAVREADFQREDVARRLLTLALDARFRDRRLSVALAQATTTIVDAIESRAIAELRFEAWKFLSAILREAGRYAELPRAFTQAAEAAAATRDPDVAHASVLLSRALYYSEPDIWKPRKAAALLNRAERVFALRDASRLHALRIARAFLLFRSGDMHAAREAFAAVLAATPEHDREAYLNALINSMWVRVELHDSGIDVERALKLIIEESEAAGRLVAVTRTYWMMGRVQLLRGEYGTAAGLLKGAMESIGDVDSSIRIGLDALQALLLADRYQDAHALARELASAAIALDRSEPSRRRDLTSQVLAYLREAAQRQALTADLVTECAYYLDRIARQPPVQFVPPMPLTEM